MKLYQNFYQKNQIKNKLTYYLIIFIYLVTKKKYFQKKLEENLIPTNNKSYLIKWISSLRKP